MPAVLLINAVADIAGIVKLLIHAEADIAFADFVVLLMQVNAVDLGADIKIGRTG